MSGHAGDCAGITPGTSARARRSPPPGGDQNTGRFGSACPSHFV